MPIYEYICFKCEHELEIVQKITAGALRKCPSCNSLKLRRKISRSAFHLKGDGWYVTDYANSGKENESKESDKTAPDSKESDKTAPDSKAKDTTSTKESKNSSKEKTKNTKVDKVKSST